MHQGAAYFRCIVQLKGPAEVGAPRVYAGQEPSKTGHCCSYLSWDRHADAAESHLTCAGRCRTTSTALICPLTPSWEYRYPQGTERLATHLQ